MEINIRISKISIKLDDLFIKLCYNINNKAKNSFVEGTDKICLQFNTYFLISL